jgi:hypothetical protein
MRRYPKRYAKDLTRLTTIRISESLRDKAEKCADSQGISFSDFVRQSLTRNIHVAQGIEAELNRINLDKSMGR